MKKYYQKNNKDCLQCSLGTLLNIDYNTIPAFYEAIKDMNNPTKEEGDRFDESVDKWLYDNGFIRVYIEMPYSENGVLFPYFSVKPIKFLGILKKKDRNFSHSVVLELKEKDCTIIHDPKKYSDYDIRDLTHIEKIFPILKIKPSTGEE